MSAIGRAVERVEDLRLLSGRGSFVDDLTRPDLLHAAILRSSIAHGRIVSIDATRARAVPGVHAIFTAHDIAKQLNGIPRIPLRQEALPELEAFEQPVIAHETVNYVGEPIAIVIADTAACAEDAIDDIDVNIEPLALEEHCAITLSAVRGDADAAFADAPFTRRETFKVHRHTAVPMETRGVLAEWDNARGKLTLLGASKVPFPNRRVLAKQLGLALDAIEMIEGDTGGSFGVRGEFYPEDFLVSYAAKRLGRAVKWIEDRREHLIATNHARDAECELEIACERDGRIRALRGRVRTDVGAYLRTNGVTPSRNIGQVSTGPYRIPHARLDIALTLTNKTPVGTYRGPGRYETDFFRERLFDIVARDLDIDRVEFRRRNLVSPNEIPWSLPVVQPFGGHTATDTGNYAAALERCLAEFDWANKKNIDGKLIDGRHHGIALGCYIEGGASGPAESARIVLENDGAYSIYTGSSLNGQGLETVFTQIAADALEVPMSAIRGIFHGSTSGVKQGYGSYASRSVVMGGSAIVEAAKKLREKMKSSNERPLEAEGTFESNKRTYSYGTHAAHVAVDPKTGCVEVIDYVAVEDVGRIINPETLHGQTLGAIVQGLGAAFLEHLVYDEEGQLLSGSLADYLLPSAVDFPNVRVFALEDYPSPNNPLGAKGAGEGGIIAVGGVIANAVASALSSLNAKVTDLPLSPPRVWQLIQRTNS